MRLSSVFLNIGVTVTAAVTAFFGAGLLVAQLELRSVEAVQNALLDEKMAWTRVISDGLFVIIEGESPSELSSLKAVTVAGAVVDASRIINNIDYKSRADIKAPEFVVEILRNDSGIFLIGLIPAEMDRDALARRLGRIAGTQPVSDLMESADYPTPDGWNQGMNFALTALSKLPRSKISLTQSDIIVEAGAASREQKRALEQQLNDDKPDGFNVTVAITAPRPVISPFITRFVLEPGRKIMFEACSASDTQEHRQILDAAAAVGLSERSTCNIALGAPSKNWGNVVAESIQALSAAGGGVVTVSDTEVTLIGLEGADPEAFTRATEQLKNKLPALYVLTANLPEVKKITSTDAPHFDAVLDSNGLTLNGQVPDESTDTLAETFARAKFINAPLTMNTEISENLPRSWSLLVLTGLKALSLLETGQISVDENNILITGTTTNEQAATEISGLFIDELGDNQDFSVNVDYIAPPEPEVEDTISPEACISSVNTAIAGRKITFDPGSATLTATTLPIIDDIAGVLKDCTEVEIEVAGYTDSQGGEDMNTRLSQQRATSVLSALRLRRVLTTNFTAKGYGEADPISSNDTEEGRETNRRIEFRLYRPEKRNADALEAAQDTAAE